MMVDFAVILASCISLFLFVLIHFLVFRRIDKHSLVPGILFTMVAGNIVAIIFISGFFIFWDQSGEIYAVLWLLSLILFNLLALSYILGFFGMMVASLRIRILQEIYSARERGISGQDLVQKYNEKMIVDERLKRLLKSGEVVKKDNEYILVNKLSVFRIHHNLYMIFKKLYT